MKNKKSIKLKATFLLIVFALNTVAGFACAIGVNMGFNTKHHEEEATEAVVHPDQYGKEHIPEEKKESHSSDKSHKHDEANKLENSKSDEGNCCTNTVKKFQDVDKSVPASQSIVHPIFFTAFAAVYYNISLLPPSDIIKDIRPFVRRYHTPIPDIRIAIHSFQI